MTDRPIIFSAPMVRALLAGAKTQTRRLAASPLRRCQPADRLWVREAWSGLFWSVDAIDGAPREYWETPKEERTAEFSSGAFYRADEDAKEPMVRFVPEGQWTPSIHMPRWASRLTLIVEDVRTEYLPTICEGDAIAEGVSLGGGAHPIAAYRDLWDSLHTKQGERWQDYPLVVALTFRAVRANIDRVPA